MTGPLKKYCFIYFWCKIQVLHTNEKCKSQFNNYSSKDYLLFFSVSAINKIVPYLVGLI